MLSFFHFLIESQKRRELDFEILKPLSSISTMGVGGKADFFILPKSAASLISIITEAELCGLPYTVVGNSSNVIYSDEGYKGVVIGTKYIDKITLSERLGRVRLSVGAGAMLPRLAAFAAGHALTGFEGLCSIPGTVGGAVISNAGAFGQEISDGIYGIFLLTHDKKLVFRRTSKSMFSYRKCNAVTNGETVLSVLFALEKGDKNEIAQRMELFRQKRRESQPTGVKSAGSYFKRPDIPKGASYFGMSAGELIDMCGLKGLRIGGATVSEKHANFIINDGKASAYDVKMLADTVKQEVYKRTGVVLCEEAISI